MNVHYLMPISPMAISGGWFDAGDYLKFVETASFTDTLLLWTLRDYGGGLPGRPALGSEARFGLSWLMHMWDQRRRVLYYQVGIGNGNGSTVLGDHDLWRLPQADDHRYERPNAPAYFIEHRPVFAANPPGGRISPNLAGRVAAAAGEPSDDIRAPAAYRRRIAAHLVRRSLNSALEEAGNRRS